MTFMDKLLRMMEILGSFAILFILTVALWQIDLGDPIGNTVWERLSNQEFIDPLTYMILVVTAMFYWINSFTDGFKKREEEKG